MIASGEGGGGGRGVTPLYKPYSVCAVIKGRVFALFWSEIGRLCPFWCGIGYVFQENYGSV